MDNKNSSSLVILIVFSLFLVLNSCKNKVKEPSTSTTLRTDKEGVVKTVFPSDVIPFFDDWKLILGDGSNAGIANNFENKDFFFTANDANGDWIVFKAPNGGDTHGTSNNTRTELAQIKK